jgi:hypothetical protein
LDEDTLTAPRADSLSQPTPLNFWAAPHPQLFLKLSDFTSTFAASYSVLRQSHSAMVQPVALGSGAPIPEKKLFGSWTLRFWRLFEILYGGLTLMIFGFQMLTGNKRFRKMDSTDKKELAAGNTPLIYGLDWC